MRLSLLDILACPRCESPLRLETDGVERQAEIAEGALVCTRCEARFPVIRGVPRFVDGHSADQSFGFQWNTFRAEQLDSQNRAGLSAQRLWAETGWTPSEMRGRRVLDIGCGAGRFLEVMADTGCDLVGVDVSSAIDAAAVTVRGRTNVQLVQADIYRLPFRPEVFDDCYFIGVAQHTPDPEAAIKALPRFLKAGGRLVISMYERRRWTLWNGKYLLRPLTRRMNKRLLLGLIRAAMPVLFPVTDVLFRIPTLGRAIAFIVPVANYVHLTDLTWNQRYRLALLDTFDRLAPDFDHPLTEAEVRTALATSGISQIRRLTPAGVNVAGTRAHAN